MFFPHTNKKSPDPVGEDLCVRKEELVLPILDDEDLQMKMHAVWQQNVVYFTIRRYCSSRRTDSLGKKSPVSGTRRFFLSCEAEPILVH